MGTVQCISTKQNNEIWLVMEKRLEQKQTPIDKKIFEEFSKLKRDSKQVRGVIYIE
jgi:hypothetical protein